jgi:hypothetical protein
MNRLPSDKLTLVLELFSAGAGIREIARVTGAHRSTVSACIERIIADRKETIRLYKAISDALMAIDPSIDIDALSALGGHLGWTCPIHPDLDPAKFGDDLNGCPECAQIGRQSRGLKRHHVRRRELGRPILPPWAVKRPALEEPADPVAPRVFALLAGAPLKP